MKMPETQSSENLLFDYEGTSYYSTGVENEELEDANPTQETDFSEYLWMENEEEFDKEVLQKLEEEALMEQCIEAMLEDEHVDTGSAPTVADDPSEVIGFISNLHLDDGEVASGSNLNPLAAEFIPGARTSEEKNPGSF